MLRSTSLSCPLGLQRLNCINRMEPLRKFRITCLPVALNRILNYRSGKLNVSSRCGWLVLAAWSPSISIANYWQTRLTVILLNGAILDSVNTVVMFSPPVTENVCVAS